MLRCLALIAWIWMARYTIEIPNASATLTAVSDALRLGGVTPAAGASGSALRRLPAIHSLTPTWAMVQPQLAQPLVETRAKV